MSNEFFTTIKRVPLIDTISLLTAARLNTFWSRHAQLCLGSTAWLEFSTRSVTQKCPQVVGSVKWQIRDSTTNFFTLILLREQQLSTVTISAQGCWDKGGAANGGATTLFNHTLNSLGWKTQCISHPFLPIWRKRTALNSKGAISWDPTGSWRAGAGGSAKQVVTDHRCCSKLCITSTNQLSSSGPCTFTPAHGQAALRCKPFLQSKSNYKNLLMVHKLGAKKEICL